MLASRSDSPFEFIYDSYLITHAGGAFIVKRRYTMDPWLSILILHEEIRVPSFNALIVPLENPAGDGYIQLCDGPKGNGFPAHDY